MIFFVGSSSVGKTSTLKLLKQNLKHNILIAELSARSPRELMGNPPFEKLYSENIGFIQYHQLMIFEFFKTEIENKFRYFDGLDGVTIVFERSLYDVVGYTYAYLKNKTSDTTFINYLKFQADHFYVTMKLKYPNVDTKFVYFPINSRIAYEAIEARPSEYIRNACDSYLISYDWDYSVSSDSIEQNVEEIKALFKNT